jgi:hypothetical protein
VGLRTTRDDHDFGMNNAGGDWSEKVFAQKAFLDFLVGAVHVASS